MKILAAIIIGILLATCFYLVDSLQGKASCPVESVILAVFEVIGSIL
jgi:hypothetical protein